MLLSTELKSFIREHASDNTDKLLLAASRFPDIDIGFAVDQILARRQIREKLPSWYANENLIFPSRLSAEQCSSEYTAFYKQRLFRGKTFCDLTGGLGIDTFFFAQKAEQAVYVERFPDYCSAARHNAEVLNITNIDIRNKDACEMAGILRADTFYLDPARRSGSNQRAFALTDCEPDVLQIKPLLLEHAQRIILKISPMADLEETLRLLPETSEIHVLAVKNECKELLFVLEPREKMNEATPVIVYAANLPLNSADAVFSFTLQEEKATLLHTTDTVKKYLYEPHAALMKSGAFKLSASRYGLQKLHQHSHLYTSDSLCPEYPGRIFMVDHTFEFTGKFLRQLGKIIPKANLTCRNFQLSVAELRKRTGIKEGGDIYLFATTLHKEHRIFIQCHKNQSD